MPNSNIREYDVVIIGAGPAGLAAGLYAARGNVKTVILEKLIPGGQLNNTQDVENYPGMDHMTGPQISQAMEEQTKRFGCEIINNCNITNVELTANKKLIASDKGIFSAKVVIIATGSEYKKLQVPGEKEYSGKGVSYCAVCDGAFFKEKELVVVGGGDSAVEEGTFLTKFAKKVTIVHRKEQFRAEKIIQDRAFKNPKISVIWNTVVPEIKGDNLGVTSVKLKNVITNEEKDFNCDGIFIYVGLLPNTQLFKGKLDLNEAGRIDSNERMETNIPGVYAVGDVRETPLRQAVTAASDGSIAATIAIGYIESLHDKMVKK
ncbi:MAG: thioredoxin-disulfide reductase [Candidatus Melainabacteria bacterium RIFCSPHIGHO2_02_FULL_34_12]|nr:MAG: thioredoxin-disulfide reductase [Candidatus Melainabacteria bacterium RIFCSPHIGHO2_02_FULL_34_12]